MVSAEPYVPAVPVFFNVNTPELLIVASLLKAWVIHCVPLPISKFPEVGVVKPNVFPLIFATVIAPCVPVTSPASDPVNEPAEPEILIEYVPALILLEKSPAVKLAAVIPEMVLLPAAIVLFVKVCSTVRPTISSEVAGKAKLVPSVPVNVNAFDAVKVLPEAMFNVFDPLLIIVTPLIVVNVGVADVAIVTVPVPLLVVVIFEPEDKVTVPP